MATMKINSLNCLQLQSLIHNNPSSSSFKEGSINSRRSRLRFHRKSYQPHAINLSSLTSSLNIRSEAYPLKILQKTHAWHNHVAVIKTCHAWGNNVDVEIKNIDVNYADVAEDIRDTENPRDVVGVYIGTNNNVKVLIKTMNKKAGITGTEIAIGVSAYLLWCVGFYILVRSGVLRGDWSLIKITCPRIAGVVYKELLNLIEKIPKEQLLNSIHKIHEKLLLGLGHVYSSKKLLNLIEKIPKDQFLNFIKRSLLGLGQFFSYMKFSLQPGKIPNRTLGDSILFYISASAAMLVISSIYKLSLSSCCTTTQTQALARIRDGKEIVTFSEVAGVDEAKKELGEVVEFLRSRQNTTDGTQQPTRILMVGPPGTGKTLLAKAVAGEANVPFITCSASELVEIYADEGEGAYRIRHMFAEGKKNAPSIIFIDEIDALAKIRDSQTRKDTNFDQDQTLNQLLTEMDGLDRNSGVIVLGATNKAEILDPALCQFGRFDKIVMVEAPDRAGREAILKKHIDKRQLSLSPDIDLEDIATATTYLTGVDLANLVSVASMIARLANRQIVSKDDFMKAVDKALSWVVKKHPKLQGHEKAVIARHEVGHAIVSTALAKVLPGHPKIENLSIFSLLGGLLRTQIVQHHFEGKELVLKDDLRGKLVSLLGGCVAEADAYSVHISSEAIDDIKQATALAYKMISELGLGQYEFAIESEMSSGRFDDYVVAPVWGKDQEHVEDSIQKEVNAVLQSALRVAAIVISSNVTVLNGLSGELKENERIDGDLVRNWLNFVVAPPELAQFVKGEHCPKTSKVLNYLSWIHRRLHRWNLRQLNPIKFVQRLTVS